MAGFVEGVVNWIVDFVVGLKDLLVMLKDVFVSAVRGQLLSDAKALWEQLSELDLVEVLSQWWDNLEEKWNQPDLLYRWQYRGRVIGYVVAEILATFLSGGGATAAKWSAKAAKLAKILASLKLAEKASEIARKLGFEDIGEKIRRIFRGKKPDKRPEFDFDTINDTVSRQKQNRHVKGTKEWKRKKGGYFGSLDEAQEVLDAAKSGRAAVVATDNHGNPIVKYEDVTGYNNNPRAGYTDQPTNKFKIKGSTSVSVVPVSPTKGR